MYIDTKFFFLEKKKKKKILHHNASLPKVSQLQPNPKITSNEIRRGEEKEKKNGGKPVTIWTMT